MKIISLSCTHSRYKSVSTPKADVLVHCGDWDCTHSDSLKRFADWLDEQPATHKIVVAGNHDKFAECHDEMTRDILKDHCHYLRDSGVEIEGVKFWGSPWTPLFGNWSFMLPRGYEMKKIWDNIPEGIDVLITHGPPMGILDQVNYANGVPKCNVGCLELLNAVKRIKPKVHMFGHIHENHGTEQHDETLFVNCALVDDYNYLIKEPIVFNMPG